MAAEPPVLIVGAGIAGMTLALALARRGIASRIVERRAALSEAGAGIQLGPNATRILRRLGVADALEACAGKPDAIEVHDGATGVHLASLPLGRFLDERHGAPYRVAHRADLQSVLLDEVRRTADITLTLGFDVAGVGQDQSGSGAPAPAYVRSTSGETIPADVIIGADGVWSVVRDQLFPGHPLTYSGKMAARTVIPLSLASRSFARPVTGVWLGRDAHVVHYPVRAHREIAVVAIIDEPVSREGWGTAITREAVLDRLRTFSTDLIGFLGHGQDWRVWSLYDPPPLPAWSRGRIGLIGDAAHPILPFLAQGGAMAIEDAEALAKALASDPNAPERALRQVEAARRARVIKVQDAARTNGRIYHFSGARKVARDLVLRTVPGRLVMRGYEWLYGWNG
jgi:salicylate hydroxylase